MSHTPSSPYLSSSSSVETTLSSSSLSGSQSQSSSLDHARKESWEDDGSLLVRLPARTGDDDWKGGVSLRKGWEFMDTKKAETGVQGATTKDSLAGLGGDLSGGSSVGGGRRDEDLNRVSVAETVRPVNDSPVRNTTADRPPSPSSWIKSSRRSSIASKDALRDELPTPPVVLAPSSASTSSTSLQGIRPLPSPQPSLNPLKGIRPLPTPPALSEPSTSTSFFPTPPASTLSPSTRQRSATHSTTTSQTPSSSGTPPSSRSRTPSLSSNEAGPSHKRSFSAQPQLDLLRPGPADAGPSTSAPSLPLKPTWLKSQAVASSPTSPSSDRRPSTADGITTPTSASSSQTVTANLPPLNSLRRTNSPPSPLPLSPAPLLPPRPTPQVQRHVAQAEFAPSAPPLAATRAGVGVRTHHASASMSAHPPSGGVKNRLAAFAGAMYQESNAYFGQNEAASSSSSHTTTATTKSPKALHQVLFSAPGAAVRSFNSSWRGTKVPSSSSQPAMASSSGPRKVLAYDPSGPAGTLAAGEGRLFGREIDGEGSQWTLVGKNKPVSSGKKRTSGGVGGAGVLVGGKGREILPALVVRCVDYLEIWGPREEGIFRLSGRATHVQKLRNQFDTGADIDLSLSDPSDLDPNAVASVFKAYLRELPSPILTSALTPAFDAVLRKYTGSPARDNGFGVSSVARPEGSLNGVAEKAALVKEVKDLLAQLPEVHWWLIKAVASLLDHTAKFSHENKMTLSNLLLVFCPSLCLSPPFLRLLVENHTTLLDISTLSSTAGPSVAFPSKAPVLPPRPTTAKDVPPIAPAEELPSRHIRNVSTVSVDPPQLDIAVPSTSPLPTFSALAPVSSRTSAGSRRPSQDSHGSSASTSSPAKKGALFSRSGTVVAEGTVPSSWSGSIGKRRNMSTPPSPRQPEHTEGGLLLAIAGTKKNASFVDLPSANSSPHQRAQSLAMPSDVHPSRHSSDHVRPPPSPATEEPPADVLPPTGVVAARRHIFGTPISDRFKSTTTPTFHGFRRSSPKGSPKGSNDALPLAPLAESSSASSALKLRGGRHGGGGLFGAKVTPLPKDLSSSSASGKKGMWKRGSAMVGLGGSGAAGVEEGLSRTVFDAVRALEGGGSTSRKH